MLSLRADRAVFCAAQGLRERYEAHHKLRYTDESLMAAAKMSSQYISDRFLPDKVRLAVRKAAMDLVLHMHS
jgi:ATP-dependent Clp protease ATP-binding subunit ClpA